MRLGVWGGGRIFIGFEFLGWGILGVSCLNGEGGKMKMLEEEEF